MSNNLEALHHVSRLQNLSLPLPLYLTDTYIKLGIIRFYNERKGFGFIAGEDRKEYFVHASGLEEGTILHDGDRVAFIAKKGDRGLNAVNVRIV